MTASNMSTAAAQKSPARQPLSVRLVNGLLAIEPLFRWVKGKARQRMIDRAETMGIGWRAQSEALKQAIGPQALGTGTPLSQEWKQRWETLVDPNLNYPDYYCSPFHAYDDGNLSWDAATEVEVAARAVHATLWLEAGVDGDTKLRHSYHEVLRQHLPTAPTAIVDMGCSVGMSTFALHDCYPDASMTGVELSPYFLTIADYRASQLDRTVRWQHAAAEATGLPSNAYDLISLCLVCHELPRAAAQNIFAEARRLLRPGGHLAIMDMNPKSEVHRNMPPYVFTLLKSTEPFLDDYFSFDIAAAIATAGFHPPTQVINSPRHRTLIAEVR